MVAQKDGFFELGDNLKKVTIKQFQNIANRLN